jgi:hypothetical protein
MISSHHETSHDFQNLFLKKIKTIWSHVNSRVSLTRCSKFLSISKFMPQTGMNNMNINFVHIFSIV